MESIVHIHFKATNTGSKGNNAKKKIQLSLYANGKVNVFKKCSSLFSCGLASVGVCLHAWRFVLTACTHSYSTHLHSPSLAHTASLKRFHLLTFSVYGPFCYSTNSVMPHEHIYTFVHFKFYGNLMDVVLPAERPGVRF